MKNSNNKCSLRIALFVSIYPLGTSSVLLNLITMLCNTNKYIDLYTEPESLKVPFIPNDGVRLFIEPHRLHFFYRVCLKIKLFLLELFKKRSLAIQISQISHRYVKTAEWVAISLQKKPAYDIAIYATYPSLFISSFLHVKPKISIYYNLEFIDDSMGITADVDFRFVRQIERSHFRYIDWFFATSPKRAQIFHDQTQIPSDKIRVLPVLPLMSKIPISNKYFHKKFNLSESINIILITGSIGERLLQKEIINTVHTWPENTALVFHSWVDGIFDSGYGLSLKEESKDLPVYFSTEALCYNEMLASIASVSVGLAFYDDIDTNYREIFFSSNKIIEFLRCGIPVISSENKELNDFFMKYKCGFSISIENIPEALENILNNYETYRQAAFNVFHKNYSFEYFFNNAFDGILNL